ncbi:uncharacterized protein ARMOST_02900 [Armillaria ostoyae]|uniref:Uncharacterized protein n=1 Tax=Armillaria ostoyae TaxID=47428 RepID=A0A284QSX0_ARMOS|nr:uncharacterized protein ARMOST_02900 [Armillaria ostoyae]
MGIAADGATVEFSSVRPATDDQKMNASASWSRFGLRLHIEIGPAHGLAIIARALTMQPTALQLKGLSSGRTSDSATFGASV